MKTKWTQGRYNDHYLRLAPSILGTINWKMRKEDKNWIASFCGEGVGPFDDYKEAQAAVELRAKIVLETALKGLTD